MRSKHAAEAGEKRATQRAERQTPQHIDAQIVATLTVNGRRSD
jgi:hypothetical protein